MTDKITFPTDPNVPSQIIDVPASAHPIGSFVWVDLSSTTPEVSLLVRVRDENISQDLMAHWRVVTQADASPRFDKLPLPQGGQLLRALTVVVAPSMLRQGQCHHVELVVSSSFPGDDNDPKFDDPRYFDFAAIPDDVAQATWWLLEGRGQDATDEDLANLAKSCRLIDPPSPTKTGP